MFSNQFCSSANFVDPNMVVLFRARNVQPATMFFDFDQMDKMSFYSQSGLFFFFLVLVHRCILMKFILVVFPIFKHFVDIKMF